MKLSQLLRLKNLRIKKKNRKKGQENLKRLKKFCQEKQILSKPISSFIQQENKLVESFLLLETFFDKENNQLDNANVSNAQFAIVTCEQQIKDLLKTR